MVVTYEEESALDVGRRKIYSATVVPQPEADSPQPTPRPSVEPDPLEVLRIRIRRIVAFWVLAGQKRANFSRVARETNTRVSTLHSLFDKRTDPGPDARRRYLDWLARNEPSADEMFAFVERSVKGTRATDSDPAMLPERRGRLVPRFPAQAALCAHILQFHEDELTRDVERAIHLAIDLQVQAGRRRGGNPPDRKP